MLLDFSVIKVDREIQHRLDFGLWNPISLKLVGQNAAKSIFSGYCIVIL